MEAIIGLATEIGKCIVGPVKRQFTYLCCFNNNIQILRDEAQKLKDANDGLHMRVNEAKNKTQVIYPRVETWLERVSQSKDIVNGIENKIPAVRKGYLNLISRYLLSREARKSAEALKELHNNCEFEQISQDAGPASQESLPLGPKEQFETRKKIEEDIMEALRDRNANMIGICGMGGIGKTTMAKGIMHRVKEEKLFDEVVMVVVSQQVDILKLQKSIADQLGVILENVEDLKTRGYRIRTRLRDTKGILIVVDDVWKNLELEELGIPSENTSRRCVVLLTSRDRGVLGEMETQKIFKIELLREKEAWLLFRKKTGNCVDGEDLCSIAEEVAKECKGLPIALVTVGGALRNKTSQKLWADALSQLRSSKPNDLPRMLANVYKPLKLSYDYLESKCAKSIFLLCSLFKEDFNIDLETLTMYGFGLNILGEHGSLMEARNRTHALIERLKDCSLLLDGFDEHHVKMHDIVRDVAIYIAPEEQLSGSVINLKDWTSRKNYYEDCRWISITNFSTKIKFPMRLKCPRLHLLVMQGENAHNNEFRLPDSSFDGMQEIRVLFMKQIQIRSLPPTTKLLKNLKILRLNNCNDLETISVDGLLKLEILSCVLCPKITALPIEIGRLNYLRLLEIIDCPNLTRIAPGIISNLINLEELKLQCSFRKWEAKESNAKENAALAELESLTKLTCLEIEIDDISLAAEEICLPSGIVQHNIAISANQIWTFLCSSTMHIEIPKEMNMEDWINTLIRRTELLVVKGDGANQLVNLVANEKIKYLNIQSSSLVKLVNTKATTITTSVFSCLETLELYNLNNLEEIIPLGYCYTDYHSYFRNLKRIYISKCACLQYLFPPCVAVRCLAQLEVLKVVDCELIEDIFCVDHDKMEKDGKFYNQKLHRAFPKLIYLELKRLPKLKAQETLNKIVAPYNLKRLCLEGLKDDVISNMWPLCSSFSNLQGIQITDFNGIKNLMSPAIARNLVQLMRLDISRCAVMLAVIVDDKDDEVQVIDQLSLFPHLEVLYLRSLPNLRSFCQWKHNHALEMPQLKHVFIDNCPRMEIFVLRSLSTPKLQHIYIDQIITKIQDLNEAIQQHFKQKERLKEEKLEKARDQEKQNFSPKGALSSKMSLKSQETIE